MKTEQNTMTNLSFDTHSQVKRLVQKGMKEDLAEEIVDISLQNNQLDMSNLVTKDYLDVRLANLEVKIEKRFTEFEKRFAEIKVMISDTQTKLIVWMIGVMITGFSIMGSAIFALGKIYATRTLQ